MSIETDAFGALDDANVAYKQNDFERAAALFGRVALSDPECGAAWMGLGASLLSAGDAEGAAGAFAKAAGQSPAPAEAHFMLGIALRQADEPMAAANAFVEAIALGANTKEAFNHLGLALLEDGRIEDAIMAFERGRDIAPNEPAILTNLGNALGEAARLTEAIACYREALLLDPHQMQASVNLAAAVFNENDLSESEKILGEALSVGPEYPMALFHYGTIVGLKKGRVAADEYFEKLPAKLRYWVGSYDFMMAHRGPQTRVFADGFRLLEYALLQAQVDGLTIELGVRRGATARFIALHNRSLLLHGFDSFEGLPEAWRGAPKGSYSTFGELPEMPPNVTLHAGWFNDTLPPFLLEHIGPVRFLNVDCDIYSSTRDALLLLGPRLTRGSVLVFDEYFGNPGWEEDEHRALLEVAEKFGLRYSFIAFSLFSKQAAIVIE